MRLISIIALLASSFRLYSQALSVEETITYLNKISYESAGGLNYREVSISNDGYFKIADINANNSINGFYTFHWTDLTLKNEDDNYGLFRCKNDEDCIIMKDSNGKVDYGSSSKYPSNIYRRNLIVVTSPANRDSYIRKKELNGWLYLFSLLIESNAYKRDDTGDPFAPSNFKQPKVFSTQSGSSKIPLISSNGVNLVKVTIGRTVETFILDSGAGDLSISSIVENKLINDGFIKKEDYLPGALYRLADGSIVYYKRVNLKSVKVGNFTIQNVKTAIGDSKSSLLLGKTFLDQFKKWSIDNSGPYLILEK